MLRSLRKTRTSQCLAALREEGQARSAKMTCKSCGGTTLALLHPKENDRF
jgi:hypothetical protein